MPPQLCWLKRRTVDFAFVWTTVTLWRGYLGTSSASHYSYIFKVFSTPIAPIALERLEVVLDRLKREGLKARLEKCAFFLAGGEIFGSCNFFQGSSHRPK